MSPDNSISDEHPKAKPQEIPPPTYWPAVMALGTTFVFWGLVTSFIISCVGLLICTTALTGWIGELRANAPRQAETEN